MSIERALQTWATYDQDIHGDPYLGFTLLREKGSVHRVDTISGTPAWVILDDDLVRQALTDPRLVNDGTKVERPANLLDPMGLMKHLLTTDPPEHTRLRKLFAAAFTPRRTEALAPRITEIAGALLDEMAHHDEVDLLSAFAEPLPITVICELLGVPPADRDTFRGDVVNLISNNGDREKVKAAGMALAGYIWRLLETKRAAPGDDLLSALITAHDDEGRLDDAELMSGVFLLLVAGHETTVNLIGNGAVALLRHPDQLAALRDDPALIPNAVEELLRYDSPVQTTLARWAVEDVRLGGVDIPAGAQVLMALGAANRDPARHPAPDTLDVTRPNPRHLSFGHGVHFCLGAPLARLEGRIAFTMLLDRFPKLELAPGADLRIRPNLTLRGYTTVPVLLR